MAQQLKSTKWVQKGRPKRRYVLASRTEAVVYEPNRKGEFIFLKRLTNPHGRMQEGEWVSDRPGSAGGVGGSIHHALEPENTHRENSAKKFATGIAHALEKMRLEDPYDELVIAAEPHFLGLLRTQLPSAVRALVQEEIPREFTRGSDGQRQAQVLHALETRGSAQI